MKVISQKIMGIFNINISENIRINIVLGKGLTNNNTNTNP